MTNKSSCSCNKDSGMIKYASFTLVDHKPLSLEKETLMVKEASSKKEVDGNSNINNFLKEQMAAHPEALFFKSKAIEADIPNNNGDFFSEEQLKKACHTFVGVPFFTNHQNDDVEKAKGKVVHAEWNEKDKAIYTISFVDRQAYPHLCRAIEEEYVTGVSMGSMHGDAIITMADFSEKKIKDVKVGDSVLTPFGKSCEVKLVHKANLGKPMYKLNIDGFKKSPLFSNDHPIYILPNKDVFDRRFVEVQNLKRGNYVLFPVFEGSKIKNSKNRIKIKTEDGLDFVAVFLNSVSEVQFDDYSYDLTVADDECYIANGIAVHNCSVGYSICSICGNKAASQDDYCFVSGTPIVMSDYSVKNIEDISIGDKVIDAFGEETEVTNVFSRNVDEKVEIISSRNIVDDLICTKNHPFLVRRRGSYNFVPAEFLADKETLLTPIPKKEYSDNIFKDFEDCGFTDSEENKLLVCKLLGYYLAEGNLLHNASKIDIGVEITLNSSEVGIVNEIKDISLKLFGKLPEFVDRSSYGINCVSLRIYNDSLVKIVKKTVIGKAKTKKISKEFLNVSERYIKHFLSSYIDGDGYSDKLGRIIITTASRDLTYQLFYILLKMGVSCSANSYYQNCGPKNRLGKTKIYRISLGSSQMKFIRDCGDKCGKSMDVAKTKGRATKLLNVFTKDGNFQKHNSYVIEESDFDGIVFNFETKSGSYVANNTSVHNCHHIKNLKGRKFTGTATDVRSGQVKSFKEASVYEDNYDIRFIELSGVVDPACSSCRIGEVYKADDLLKAATTCYNGLSVFKTTEMFKKASQEDVDRLNQALEILQDVAIKLIKNRQNIEMEFSADIVKILADLQEYVDGLVQAGFGKIQDTPQDATGGVPQNQGQDQSSAIPGLDGNAAPAMPVSEEKPLSDSGTVTGDPTAPLVTPPAENTPNLSDLSKTMRPSPGKQKATQLQRPVSPRKASEQDGDSKMRRIAPVVSQQKDKVSSVLERDWQEKLEKFSNTLRDSIKEEIRSTQKNRSGGTIMSTKIIQEAKAKQAPNSVLEKRLDDDRSGLHPRTESVKEDVVGKQLAGLHEGEKDVTEQVLLDDVRTEEVELVVEETFVDKGREGDVTPETLQKKLEKQRTNKEPETIIENLLGTSTNNTPSTRSAASLSDHVDSAIDIVSKAVVFAQSTPDRVLKMAGAISGMSLADQAAMVSKIKTASASSIPSYEDVQKRASFWADKGLQITAASDKEIKEMIVAFASKSVKENNLNPELVIRAFAVLKNNPNSVAVVTNKVKEIIASGIEHSNHDVEDEISKYINKKAQCDDSDTTTNDMGVDKKGDKKSDKKDDCEKGEKDKKCKKEETVKAETKALEESLLREAKNVSDLVIETNFDEMGIPEKSRNNDAVLASCAESFARGACAHLGVKMAAVVNVTVDGESGDVVIAVDTGEGSVEIPVGGEKEDEENDLEIGEETPDLGAEPAPAMDNTETGNDFASPAPATGSAPAAPTAGGLGSMTSSKKKIRTAQFGGGSPGAGGPAPEGGNAQDPTAGLNTPPSGPGEGEGLQSFTDEEEDELPGDEEQKEPGSICFICGSTDTETGRKDQAPGQFDCNNCGAKYTVHVNVEVLNPQETMGDKDEDLDKEIESPEIPSMPVAAEVVIDREGMKRIAKHQKEIGDICPACGGVDVDVEGERADAKITCKKCHTQSEKSVFINAENPMESFLRVAWTLDPMKRKCASCRKAAKKFAADKVFSKMVKKASVNKIPENKVRGWLKANYPEVEFVKNGPFKGQSFADTIIDQLNRFGLNKTKYLVGLASVQAKEDPMDQCIRDQKKKGYTLAESKKLCDCMKAKYASEEDDNIYIQALSGKADINILRKMADYDNNNIFKKTAENTVSIDENASLEALPEVVVESESKSEKITLDIFDDVTLSSSKEQKKTACDFKNPPPDVTKSNGETKVKDLGNSEKKVDGDGIVNKDNHMCNDKATKANPSRGAIGGEETAKIPGPDVPRGDATMGKETKAPEEGVKVPSKGNGTDTSALGQSEASTEENKMNKKAYSEEENVKDKDEKVEPADKTSGDTAMKEKGCHEKKVEKVEDIAGNVDVPRKDATINDEEPAATKKPEIPRSNATMGHENPPEAKEPTIPSEVSETQVKMVGKNTTEAERQNQLEKIATVRREHAMRYAGQLIEKGLIKEEEIDSFVSDLSSMPLDRMKTHVALLLKSVTVQKTASTPPAQTTLTTPIIREASSITVPVEKEEPTLTEKLSKMFTIADGSRNRAIRLDLSEREKEDKNLFTI